MFTICGSIQTSLKNALEGVSLNALYSEEREIKLYRNRWGLALSETNVNRSI